MKIKLYKFYAAILIVISVWLSACATIEVFEKNTTIPQRKWQYNFRPNFEFTITDTVSQYNLLIVLRHTDAYRYNNIWLDVGTQTATDSMRNQRFDLQLGTDAKGWEGAGMDDIWEVRKSVTNGPFKFKKKGVYKFSIAQVMRENPLTEIISVGVRVEKVK